MRGLAFSTKQCKTRASARLRKQSNGMHRCFRSPDSSSGSNAVCRKTALLQEVFPPFRTTATGSWLSTTGRPLCPYSWVLRTLLVFSSESNRSSVARLDTTSTARTSISIGTQHPPIALCLSAIPWLRSSFGTGEQKDSNTSP